MDKAQEFQSAIELLKISMFIDIMESVSGSFGNEFEEFVTLLVKNGCPASAVINTIKAMAERQSD